MHMFIGKNGSEKFKPLFRILLFTTLLGIFIVGEKNIG